MEAIQISIIIVNYNVEHFLQLCLASVFKSLEGIKAEVWVVDNHSSDGSVKMVRKKFPQVHLVDNQENLGFSKANNLAIRQAKGENVLLLNPDTILAEDTVLKCLNFIKS